MKTEHNIQKGSQIRNRTYSVITHNGTVPSIQKQVASKGYLKWFFLPEKLHVARTENCL